MGQIPSAAINDQPSWDWRLGRIKWVSGAGSALTTSGRSTSCTSVLQVSYRAILNWVSKVIRDCIGFALLRSVIGLENSRHPLNQSDAKLKPIATWSLAFSRAWDRLRVFTLSSHWFVVIFIFVLIGRCDYFGFGFSTLNWKLLYF